MTLCVLRAGRYCLALALLIIAGQLFAYQTASIGVNKRQYQLEIKYPQSFTDESIDKVVEQHMNNVRQSFIRHVEKESAASQDLPGKNSLIINYKVSYLDHDVTSLLFRINRNYRGNAHPEHNLLTLNFIGEQIVALEDVFKDPDYLLVLAEYSRQSLSRSGTFDKAWLQKGTAPEARNYQKWQFSEEGILLFFDTYQIAPYVDGPQQLLVPVKAIEQIIRPEIKAAVWGAND